MNMYTNTKKLKKLIIVLVVIILFNFCYPKNVKAWFEFEDILAAPAYIFWFVEEGILTFLNNIFTNSTYNANSSADKDGDYIVEKLTIYLTPETIIKGKFILFDANIFKEINGSDGYYDYVPGGEVSEGKIRLREVISGWYYALRNFAIVALLSVLVYVGIRMITSSIAQDKAKYKIMFKDWLVALCLVVVMHYMMIAILNFTDLITKAIGGGENADMMGTLSKDITGILSEEGDSRDYTYNGMGLADAYAKIAVVAGIIIYTFIFAIKYLKREFTIIFLILLGPISCITYPIDKISDGKAQAFNKWFSEFLYQVIIQPFHLLLYVVLIGTAIELANANVIYALVCFAVMIPAEKFIKEMFGFKDKLGSPLGAFASGAIASKALSSLTKKGGSGGGSQKQSDSAGDSSNALPPKTVDTPELSRDADNKRGKMVIDARYSKDWLKMPNPGLEGENNPESNSGGDKESTSSGLDADDADALAAGTGAAIGASSNAEEGEEGKDVDKQLDQNEAYNKSLEEQSRWEKIKSIHEQRATKKWGSTNRKQRWINRGKKALGSTAKLGVKALGTVGGAAVGGTLGFMTGKGATGFLTGAAVGSGLANRTISGARGIANTVGGAVSDYKDAFRDSESKEKKALEAFKADPKQMEKALASYRKNHKGQEPTHKQLNQEMEDRFALSRYGLKEEQIDKSVKYYQEARDKDKVPNEKALKDTVFAAKLAEEYDKKDFRNALMMNNAATALTNKFEKQGVTREVAYKNARNYLEKAAKIKGVKGSMLD